MRKVNIKETIYEIQVYIENGDIMFFIDTLTLLYKNNNKTESIRHLCFSKTEIKKRAIYAYYFLKYFDSSYSASKAFKLLELITT